VSKVRGSESQALQVEMNCLSSRGRVRFHPPCSLAPEVDQPDDGIDGIMGSASRVGQGIDQRVSENMRVQTLTSEALA